MGIFEDFGTLIPADKQEAFKQAVSALDGAIKIDSRETVDKLASENPFVKSAFDAAISRAVASHDEKFKAEKLPGLIAEEMKKNAPKPKDPELAAALGRVEALEKAKAQAERETFRISQLSKVLPKLTEMGLDADLADRLIGNSEAETEDLIARFEKSFVKARDGYTEKVLKERFGNMAAPPRGAGVVNTREAMIVRMNDLAKSGNYQEVLKLQDEISRMKE